MIRRIREGKTLTDALDEAHWIPELALDMIGVGESSGALQPMFDEVANFYDAEIDVRLNALTTLIEPAILVFMGSLVLTILLAIYLPILQVCMTKVYKFAGLYIDTGSGIINKSNVAPLIPLVKRLIR